MYSNIFLLNSFRKHIKRHDVNINKSIVLHSSNDHDNLNIQEDVLGEEIKLSKMNSIIDKSSSYLENLNLES